MSRGAGGMGLVDVVCSQIIAICPEKVKDIPAEWLRNPHFRGMSTSLLKITYLMMLLKWGPSALHFPESLGGKYSPWTFGKEDEVARYRRYQFIAKNINVDGLRDFQDYVTKLWDSETVIPEHIVLPEAFKAKPVPKPFDLTAEDLGFLVSMKKPAPAEWSSW